MDMLPQLSIPNLRNECFADAKVSSDFTLRFGGCSDLTHIGFGQLGAAVIDTAPHSPFGRGILHIGQLSPEEQMRWIDAPSDVASMQYPQFKRDRAILDNPAEPMSTDHSFAIVFSATNHDLPVPVGATEASRPQPTRAEFGEARGLGPMFVDPAPESGDRFFIHASIDTIEGGRK